MTIRIDVADAVATLAFSRPEKKNAITAAMYQTLGDALLAARDDPAVRVVRDYLALQVEPVELVCRAISMKPE